MQRTDLGLGRSASYRRRPRRYCGKYHGIKERHQPSPALENHSTNQKEIRTYYLDRFFFGISDMSELFIFETMYIFRRVFPVESSL